MRLDDLLDELLESSPILLSLKHFSVDGNFGVECLLRVEQHLQLDHQRLTLFAHLSDGRIAIVQRCLVASLIVFQLVVQFLDLLLEQCIL